jgi:ABC-type proline/glycine betaine transport system ATPase subunit
MPVLEVVAKEVQFPPFRAREVSKRVFLCRLVGDAGCGGTAALSMVAQYWWYVDKGGEVVVGS